MGASEWIRNNVVIFSILVLIIVGRIATLAISTSVYLPTENSDLIISGVFDLAIIVVLIYFSMGPVEQISTLSSNEENQRAVNGKSKKWIPSVVLITSGLLMIMHIWIPDDFQITWPIIGLLILVILAPYTDDLIEEIESIDLPGDAGVTFEATGTDENQISMGVIQDALEDLVGVETDESMINALQQDLSQISRRRMEIAQEIRREAADNPEHALVDLRKELESVIRDILESMGLVTDYPTPLAEMIDILEEENVIDRNLAHDLTEVRMIANKAAHNEEVSNGDARFGIREGLNSLERIYYIRENLDNFDN